MVDRHDDLLLAIARTSEGIKGLLDVMFSFLSRRTDFYHIMTSENEKMGFPKGKALEILLDVFNEHQLRYTSRSQESLLPYVKHQQLSVNQCINQKIENSSNRDKKQNRTIKSNTTNYSCSLPSVSSPSLITHSSIDPSQTTSTTKLVASERISDDGSHKNPTKKCLSPPFPPTDSLERKDQTNDISNTASSRFPSKDSSPSTPTNSDSFSTLPPISPPLSQLTSNKSETSSISNKRISVWNGGKTDRYWWSQSISDLTVDISLSPPHPTTKNDINVDIKPEGIRIVHRGVELLKGEWFEGVDVGGSTWCIEDGDRLLMTLEKGRENWWSSLVKGDPSIDTSSIESVKRIDEYDEATQASIRKMMFDHSQTSKGLPTSDQAANEKFLRRAWEGEGSPFKGMEFDPSMMNIDLASIPKEMIDRVGRGS